jgi:hypothetical protein
MIRRIRRLPSPALIVASIALVFAIAGGIGYAASKINGNRLKDHSVAGKKLKSHTIGAGKLKDHTLTGRQMKSKSIPGGKLKPDTVTGLQVNESTLGKVPSATQADNATHATNADHATSADNAANAVNATNATNAARATIGESPVAWAQVAANGTVVAGRGITSANVSRQAISAYCFHGLTFSFQSAAVTVDYANAGFAGDVANFGLGSPFADCNAQPGTQAEVATSHGTTFTPKPFFVQFFN